MKLLTSVLFYYFVATSSSYGMPKTNRDYGFQSTIRATTKPESGNMQVSLLSKKRLLNVHFYYNELLGEMYIYGLSYDDFYLFRVV